MSIIRVSKTKNYSVISNGCFRDPELSARAKGIYGFVMTLSDDWEVHRKNLYKHFTEGRDAIDTAWDELIQAGYVVKVDQAVRGKDGKYCPSHWLFYEVPQLPENHRSLKNRSLKNRERENRELKTRELINTNRERNTKERITPYSPPQAGGVDTGVFLERWNKLAARYGFSTSRVFHSVDSRNLVKAGKEINSVLGNKGWDLFWENVEDTMRTYQGCTYVKYFRMPFILRPAKVAELIEGPLSNFPIEKDEKYQARLIEGVRKTIIELQKRASFLSDKLDAANEKADEERARKYTRRLKKVTAKIANERKRIAAMEGE